LDTNFSLKLADCALARDLFPNDYHCLANNEYKPVAWMSFESLNENVNNIRTEIWSCGVFLWECFSLCAQPYDNIDPFDLGDYLFKSEQNRLQKPLHCPNELFDLYKKCWLINPENRPSLKEVFYTLHKFYSSLDNYV
jgi:RYK receptor-like tyrosine kinase